MYNVGAFFKSYKCTVHMYTVLYNTMYHLEAFFKSYKCIYIYSTVQCIIWEHLLNHTNVYTVQYSTMYHLAAF